MSEAAKRCGNCRTQLKFLKLENIQLGKTSFILGDWPNLLAGAQNLEFWVCPHCRKLELYIPDLDEVDGFECEDAMAQTVCPICGIEHDLDDPKCPHCGAKNPSV